MEIDSFNWPFLRPIVHRYNRRAVWHDYRSRCYYMITITAQPGVGAFSRVCGAPGNALNAPHIELTTLGTMINEELRSLCAKYSELSIRRKVIMPDHLHFVVFVTKPTEYHLGKAIGSLKGSCSHRYKEMTGTGASLFKEGFHDRILFREGQLTTMLNYVANNPLRYLLKKKHPDFFTRHTNLTINCKPYQAIGNIFLLRNTDIQQVKVSRRYTREQLETLDAQWIRTIEESGVLVSPFISPAEKIYRDLAIKHGGNVILICENGFGERYKPGGKYFDLCVEGRLLAIAPLEHKSFRRDITYSRAQQLNNLARCIADGRFEASIKN